MNVTVDEKKIQFEILGCNLFNLITSAQIQTKCTKTTLYRHSSIDCMEFISFQNLPKKQKPKHRPCFFKYKCPAVHEHSWMADMFYLFIRLIQNSLMYIM